MDQRSRDGTRADGDAEARRRFATARGAAVRFVDPVDKARLFGALQELVQKPFEGIVWNTAEQPAFDRYLHGLLRGHEGAPTDQDVPPGRIRHSNFEVILSGKA
jgi:hypothetical protein